MANRLYVGNLAFEATENLIEKRFSECGEVASVALMLDRASGRSRGFAFVEMGSPTEAAAAIKALDGSEVNGRALRVSEAQERKARPSGGGGRQRDYQG